MIPEPKTPQELNEAVVKRLGFDFDYGHNGTIITTAYEKGYEVFRPATHPAAAVLALDKYCATQTEFNPYDRHTWDMSTDIYSKNKSKGKYVCTISSPEDTFCAFGKTFSEAACLAILETER